MTEIFSRHHLFRVIDLAEFIVDKFNPCDTKMDLEESKKIPSIIELPTSGTTFQVTSFAPRQWIPLKIGLINTGNKWS